MATVSTVRVTVSTATNAGKCRAGPSLCVVIAFALVFVGCQALSEPYDSDGPVAKRLEAFRSHSREGEQRRLDEFTDFAWDTVYLFDGAVTHDAVNRVLGTEWLKRDGQTQSSEALVVFVSRGRVVHALTSVGLDVRRSDATRSGPQARRAAIVTALGTPRERGLAICSPSTAPSTCGG